MPMKKQRLKNQGIKVYGDALKKHSWDVNEAFNDVKRAMNVKTEKQRCRVMRNFEVIKECFESIDATQSNRTIPVVQARSAISTEDKNLESGGMEEAGSGEEIDALLSPEHRASIHHELRTMISNLSSQLESFLPVSEPDRGENSEEKGIQIANDDTRFVEPEAEFKWNHFETALKVIKKMFCQAPSNELADEVDKIVNTKIITGNYDFSRDESVVRFVEKVSQYTQLVRYLFSNEHQKCKEQLSNDMESQIKFMKERLEAEMTKIEEKVKFLAKAGPRADVRLSLLKRDLEMTLEQKKHLECELGKLVTKLNQLNSDLERYERERNDMATDQNEIEQFVGSTLNEYRRNAQSLEEILRSRLGYFDEMHKRELEGMKMVILHTSIQNTVTSSGSSTNPILVKEE